MWSRAVSATAAVRNPRFSGVLVRRLVPSPMRVSCLSPSGTVEVMSPTYPFSPFGAAGEPAHAPGSFSTFNGRAEVQGMGADCDRRGDARRGVERVRL